MTAAAFVLTSLRHGHVLGHSLICPDARYVSSIYPGADRIDRRFAQAAEWKALLVELADTLPAGSLPETSMILRVLVDPYDREATDVRYLAHLPIEGPLPESLDRALRGLAAGG